MHLIKAFYINLDFEESRRKHMERQLKHCPVPHERFGVSHVAGYKGNWVVEYVRERGGRDWRAVVGVLSEPRGLCCRPREIEGF
jgi:hypothetical protein